MTMLLFDFRQPQGAKQWSAVDDVVMGGVSSSRMIPTPNGTAIFSGRVSLENSGGFASITSGQTQFDIDGYNGIALNLRGDGKRYSFIIRCKEQRPRYECIFTTEPNTWETVYLPFGRFIPKIFGMRLPVAPSMNLSAITSCGLIISNKQEGAFMLEIEWIAAYPMPSVDDEDEDEST